MIIRIGSIHCIPKERSMISKVIDIGKQRTQPPLSLIARFIGAFGSVDMSGTEGGCLLTSTLGVDKVDGMVVVRVVVSDKS